MHAPRWTGAGVAKRGGEGEVSPVVQYFAGRETSGYCSVLGGGLSLGLRAGIPVSVSWAAAAPDGRVRAVDADQHGCQGQGSTLWW